MRGRIVAGGHSCPAVAEKAFNRKVRQALAKAAKKTKDIQPTCFAYFALFAAKAFNRKGRQALAKAAKKTKDTQPTCFAYFALFAAKAFNRKVRQAPRKGRKENQRHSTVILFLRDLRTCCALCG